MSDWTDEPTEARQSVDVALRVVDSLLSYMSPERGKPTEREKALFAAVVVFSYGVWESFVEELAIEVAMKLSSEIDASRVPTHVRELLEQSSTAWQLSVHPGWKALWIQRVQTTAKGEGDKYGLNTARVKQVSSLLRTAGIEDAFRALPTQIIPPHVKATTKTVAAAVDQLVSIRAEIVHSGSVPKSLKKNDAREWRQFVEALATELDEVCRRECAKLLR
jgi:hypothetical protein